MDDSQMDHYISRNLKNWVAGRQASPPPREQVVSAAGSSDAYQEPQYFQTREVVHEYAHHRLVGYYTGEWIRGSFTMSLSWPANLATIFQTAS
ncbi:MAG: hypothetical protein ACKOC5_15455 [Chloroflexota bacterium]